MVCRSGLELELTNADCGAPTDNTSRDELVDRVGLDVGRLQGVDLKQQQSSEASHFAD